MIIEAARGIDLGEGRIAYRTGNYFSLNQENAILKTNYANSIRNSDQLNESLKKIVNGVADKYVQSWRFNVALGDEKFLGFVFTHPIRPNLAYQPPDITEFLKPEFILPIPENVTFSKDFAINEWFLDTTPLNELLVGTNLYAYNVFAAYNELKFTRRGGLFVKKDVPLLVFQTGVALIGASLYKLQDKIESLEDKIETIMEERIKPLQTEKDLLASQITDSPVNLFS